MREIQACQGSAMLCKAGIFGWIAALHLLSINVAIRPHI